MFSRELRTVPVESIPDEYRYIIHPCIPRGSRKKNPVVTLGNLLEGSNPLSRSNQPLLVKHEKCILYVLVLFDVVPAIDGKDTVDSSVLLLSQEDVRSLPLPIFRVTFLCGRDDINILMSVLELIVS